MVGIKVNVNVIDKITFIIQNLRIVLMI